MKQKQMVKNDTKKIVSQPIEQEIKVDDYIKNHLASLRDRQPHNYEQKIAAIKEIVTAYYGLQMSDYSTRSREEEFVKLRQITFYFIQKYCPQISYKAIGRTFGFDHATIIHSLKQVDNQYETNREYKKEIDEIDTAVHYKSALIDNEAINGKEYYFLDMNNVKIMKFTNNKAVVFVNIEDEKIKQVQSDVFNDGSEIKEFTNTKLHILRKQ